MLYHTCHCSGAVPLLLFDACTRRVEDSELGLGPTPGVGEDEDLDGYGPSHLLIFSMLRSCVLSTLSHTDTSLKHGRQSRMPHNFHNLSTTLLIAIEDSVQVLADLLGNPPTRAFLLSDNLLFDALACSGQHRLAFAALASFNSRAEGC